MLTDETRYFFELTPERILTAVESSGLRCTGRCLTLNSMENRVYDVEIEVDDESTIRSPSDRFRIIKFYRPGRWSEAQILEEHEFLQDLKKAEIPVVAPESFGDGRTLHKIADIDIWYAMFPKQGGRSPDELLPGYAQRLGRLLARVHAVGAERTATHRITLSPETYGRENLNFLIENRILPAELENAFSDTVESICELSTTLFKGVPNQRIHGDCHFRNILWGSEGPFLVDFDDMVMGPQVQDLWLLIPGADLDAKLTLDVVLDGYEEMRSFDRQNLSLIESLRALRIIHFSAWIAKRWHDPAFPAAFPQFETPGYWQGVLGDLRDQLELIKEERSGRSQWA